MEMYFDVRHRQKVRSTAGHQIFSHLSRRNHGDSADSAEYHRMTHLRLKHSLVYLGA